MCKLGGHGELIRKKHGLTFRRLRALLRLGGSRCGAAQHTASSIDILALAARASRAKKLPFALDPRFSPLNLDKMTFKAFVDLIKAAGTPAKRPAQPAAQPTLAAAQSTATAAAAALPSDDAAPVRRNRLARRLKVLVRDMNGLVCVVLWGVGAGQQHGFWEPAAAAVCSLATACALSLAHGARSWQHGVRLADSPSIVRRLHLQTCLSLAHNTPPSPQLAQRKAKRTGELAPAVLVAQEEEPTLQQAEDQPTAPQEEDQPTQEEARPPQEELPLVANDYGLTPEERALIQALVSGMMERVVARQTAAAGDKAAAALLLARLLARVSPLFARKSVGGAESGNDNSGSGNDSGDNDDGACSPAAGGKVDKAASGAALKAKLAGAWSAARKSLLLPRLRRRTTVEREDVAASDSPATAGVSAVVIAAPAALEGAAVNGQQAGGQAVGKSSGKKAGAVLAKVKRGLCFSV